MAVCNAGFEFGIPGATLTAADPPDGDAFTSIQIVAGGTLAYDTTHVALGAQALKVATGGTAGTCLAGWTELSNLGTLTDHNGRAYLYFTGNPAAVTHVVTFQNAGAAAGRIAVDTAGKLRILDSANATVATSTNAIATGQWVRVEWHWIHSATVGQGELKLFNTASAALGSPTETLTTAANKNLAAQATRVNYGVANSIANAGPFWIDQVQAGATSYSGPAAVGVPSRMLLGVG